MFTFRYIALALVFSAFFCACTKDLKRGYETKQDDSYVTGKPNFLFIISDDIGYEIPTCNGGESYETPNIDFLAQTGVRFTQAHSSPLCAPSRVALLTGKYNFRNYEKWGYLRPDYRTIGNVFRNNDYATCYVGKWQLDGGDVAIKGFGWQQYCVWLPFLLPQENMAGSKYKNPNLYQNGEYLPDSVTLGKYSEDIYTDKIIEFINGANEIGKPFFVYYSMGLCHAPFSPTPDDSAFTTWDENSGGDPVYFPSMVKYMDKKIGQLYSFLDSANLLENTIIVFVGDNGTPPAIKSKWNGEIIKGGKHNPNEPGTNVPLIVNWKNNISPAVYDNLIDFTDFAPTLTNLANIPITINDSLDGVSFSSLILNGDTSNLRRMIFNSLNPEADLPERNWNRWVQNENYKLYDSNSRRTFFRFVKISKCHVDSYNLTNPTPQEKELRDEFMNVLRRYHP